MRVLEAVDPLVQLHLLLGDGVESAADALRATGGRARSAARRAGRGGLRGTRGGRGVVRLRQRLAVGSQLRGHRARRAVQVRRRQATPVDVAVGRDHHGPDRDRAGLPADVGAGDVRRHVDGLLRVAGLDAAGDTREREEEGDDGLGVHGSPRRLLGQSKMMLKSVAQLTILGSQLRSSIGGATWIR